MATKKSKRRKQLKYIYIAFVLGISMLLSAWIIASANELLALARPDREIIVEIPEGASHGKVARILKKNDVIEQTWLSTRLRFSQRAVQSFRQVNISSTQIWTTALCFAGLRARKQFSTR